MGVGELANDGHTWRDKMDITQKWGLFLILCVHFDWFDSLASYFQLGFSSLFSQQKFNPSNYLQGKKRAVDGNVT